MKPLNSRAVSESLESYAGDLYAESAFFSALSAGEARPGHVRDVFGQYYLWRNRFHRWFGICVDDVYYAILGMETELAS